MEKKKVKHYIAASPEYWLLGTPLYVDNSGDWVFDNPNYPRHIMEYYNFYEGYSEELDFETAMILSDVILTHSQVNQAIEKMMNPHKRLL